MSDLNVQPFEVIGTPFEVYLADVGSTFPAVDAAPGVAFEKLGTNGNLNQDDSGVVVSFDQKTDTWRGAGSTGARKVFRTEEDMSVAFKLVDLSLETLAKVMNGNTITTIAASTGIAGTKSIGLSRGPQVAQYAMLIRGEGISPYGIGSMQFNLPRVADAGKPKPVFTKGKPAVLDFEFLALEDLNAASADVRYGELIAQTAVAL
jgi:hypothetical protein